MARSQPVEKPLEGDALRRIAATAVRSGNEPEGDRAPRFSLTRSAAATLWRVRDDLDAATVRQLDALAAAEPVTPYLRAAPQQLDRYLAVLGASQASAAVDWGLEYCFPDALPTPGTTTTITRANLELLRHMVADLADVARDFETGQPTKVVVVDGYAVSVCFSARLTAQVAMAGVETLPAYRRRGYATAVVAAWARAVRASGRIPLYGTSWDNSASQGVARRLGLIPWASEFSVT